MAQTNLLSSAIAAAIVERFIIVGALEGCENVGVMLATANVGIGSGFAHLGYLNF